jgi:hypothetical protein
MRSVSVEMIKKGFTSKVDRMSDPAARKFWQCAKQAAAQLLKR